MVAYSQNGLRWSLYPLLATIALCEFFLGVTHLLFCSPFYPFLIPIISAIFALITAFHALFLRFPNRVDFVLQCCSAAFGMLLLVTSIAETFCGLGAGLINNDGDEHDHGNSGKRISLSQGLCYGLLYRTLKYQESCNEFLRPLHNSLAVKLSFASSTSSLRFVISFSICGLALAHTTTCIVLAYFSANGNGYSIRSYHGQLVFGIIIIPAALLHRFYCCTYFYSWLPVLVASYAPFQSFITWKHHYRGKYIRLANVVGSAAAMALIATASFGIFCTITKSPKDHFSSQRHCSWPISEYQYCYRVIDFRTPYNEWHRNYVIAEISAIQILVNIWLCLSAIAHFFLSLKSAFTTEIKHVRLPTQ